MTKKHKAPTIRSVMSLALASTIFLTSGLGASVAHAGGKEGVYMNNTSGIGDLSQFIQMAQEGKDLSDKTVILSTNDAQCDFEKYPYVASLKNFFENDLKSDVVLIDSGDFCQDYKMDSYWGSGTCADNWMNTYDNDYAAFLAMNAAGYDYANFGNYGFGDGYDNNKKDFFNTQCNIISFDNADKAVSQCTKGKGQDYYHSSDCFENIMQKDYVCDNSFVYDCADSDMKIGFFGLPEFEAYAGGSSSCDLSKCNDWYTCAEQQAEGLKEDGADLVICLSQLGLGDNAKGSVKGGGSGIFDFLGSLFGSGSGKSSVKGGSTGSDIIDLILDGCSLFAGGESAIPLKLADMLLRNIGVTIIDNNSKSIEDNFLFKLDDIIQGLGADKNVSSFIDNMLGSFGFNLFGEADCDDWDWNWDCDWDWDCDSNGGCSGKTPQPKPTPGKQQGTGKPTPKANAEAQPQPKGVTSPAKPDGAAAPKGQSTVTAPAKPDGAPAPSGQTFGN